LPHQRGFVVEGLGLYEWATRFNPGTAEVSQVLAQVARALEATHAAGGLHRDVKGDNIRVSATGRKAFLTDYGSGTYAGAAPLTRDGFAPGTPPYRSREAWEFALYRPRNVPTVYKAQPADDVYALGVSAYRCVTGEYPPPVAVREEEEGPGQLMWTAPRPPHELNPRVEPELSALILRMLSERPEERPAAAEVARALEGGAEQPAPSVKPPHAPSRRMLAKARTPAWMATCALLGAMVGALAAGWGQEDVAQAPAVERPRDPDPVGVGSTSMAAPVKVPSSHKSLGLPMPEAPFEGQRRAPHCQPPGEVIINGGCWIEPRNVKPPCGNLSYEWNGRCYIPHIPPPRKPTSEPP
jgi:hypothetical protein